MDNTLDYYNKNRPEECVHPTEKGELVRSKNEATLNLQNLSCAQNGRNGTYYINTL